MSDVVVEVCPTSVRGPNDARRESVSVALEGIDDELVLLDDRVVSVDELWRVIVRTVVGHVADSVTLVCPTGWPVSRVDRVRDAALTVAATVQVLPRTALLRDGLRDRRAVIVEITREYVVVSHLGGAERVVPRRDSAEADACEVVCAVGAAGSVLVDSPDDGALLGAAIADLLRANGITVGFAAEDAVQRAIAARRAAAAGSTEDADGPQNTFGRRRAIAVLVGAVAVVTLCVGVALPSGPPANDMPMTMLVEGRMGVLVPATWRVERVTGGSGSARVQVVSPADTATVLHLTQSAIPTPSLPAAAEALRTALAAEPDGVFVDFQSSGRSAGRDAVTYREIRPQRQVAWTVLVDGTLRIAIGCQSAPDREQLGRQVCERAVRSAHAVF